mgnify:FL=1
MVHKSRVKEGVDMKRGDLVMNMSTKRMGIVCKKGTWSNWYVIYWLNSGEKNQYHKHHLEVICEAE